MFVSYSHQDAAWAQRVTVLLTPLGCVPCGCGCGLTPTASGPGISGPRLVKRVANAFGMLPALGLHLGHHEEEDTVARAAILLIRFPALVDDLLSAVDPPSLDPPANPGPNDPVSPWLRRDVQQVAGVLIAVPIALLFNLLLARFISGFTQGAVKG